MKLAKNEEFTLHSLHMMIEKDDGMNN